MVRGDGGFTEGMLFVIFFNKGDAILNSSPGCRDRQIQNAGHICDTKMQCHFFCTIYIICCCSHTLCADLSLFPSSSHYIYHMPLSHCHWHCALTHSCGSSHLQRVPHSHHLTYQINVPSFSSPVTGPQRKEHVQCDNPAQAGSWSLGLSAINGPSFWQALRRPSPQARLESRPGCARGVLSIKCT